MSARDLPDAAHPDAASAVLIERIRRQIVDALVVAQVIVVDNECFDPSLELMQSKFTPQPAMWSKYKKSATALRDAVINGHAKIAFAKAPIPPTPPSEWH